MLFILLYEHIIVCKQNISTQGSFQTVCCEPLTQLQFYSVIGIAQS